MADAELPMPLPADALPAGPSVGSEPAAKPESAAVPEGIQHLDPRVVTLNRIVGAITGAVFVGTYLITLAIVLFTKPWPWWGLTMFGLAGIPFTGFFAWLALKWPAIDYRHWRYRVDAEGIEIWSGVLWRQAVVVPRSRVQHIDVSQGPIERSYGLATLSIHTAGTEYSKVDLPGLAHSVALTVRDALLPKGAEPAV